MYGIAAGTAATATMSGVMALAYKMGALGEPPPKKITRKITKKNSNALSWLAHFGFGASMGAIHQLVVQDRSSVVKGALFGAAVWTVSYAGWVPAAGIMPFPDDDKKGRPTAMVLAHLVFGATLALMWGGLDAAQRARGHRQRALASGRFDSRPLAARDAISDVAPTAAHR